MTAIESGHFAIAGFLYQLLGSGLEGIEVIERTHDLNGSACLLLERFGQDAVTLSTGGNERKRQLIQFKYSSDQTPVAPAELRAVLEGFLKSVRASGRSVADFEFKFVTNRRLSDSVQRNWRLESENAGRLQKAIKNSSRKALRDVSTLATIFQLTRCDCCSVSELRKAVTDAASAFGMLESEIGGRIQQLVGLVMETASASTNRILVPSEIHQALTGIPKPYGLLSAKSIEIRCSEVRRFQIDEMGEAPVLYREVSDQIARAVLEHPFTSVIGDGGSGKSVAVCDAMHGILKDPEGPPGFAMVLRAQSADARAIIDTIARWRNQDLADDGRDFTRSLNRLQRAFSEDPVLAICIDAIDEKAGHSRLPDSVQDFVRLIVHEAVTSHRESGIPHISVVLTCRRHTELRNLLSRGAGLPREPHQLVVTDFDDQELERLANSLRRDVRIRILASLGVDDSTMGAQLASSRPVAADALRAIRHPVLWRIFSRLDAESQYACLNGSHDLGRLGSDYLSWFREKSEIRMPFLRIEAFATALASIALTFRDDPMRTGSCEVDWISPCVSATACSRLDAKSLFNEALSAGLLIEEEGDGRLWRWKYAWFCGYLAGGGTPT